MFKPFITAVKNAFIDPVKTVGESVHFQVDTENKDNPEFAVLHVSIRATPDVINQLAGILKTQTYQILAEHAKDNVVTGKNDQVYPRVRAIN